jgi:hypothetical protein
MICLQNMAVLPRAGALWTHHTHGWLRTLALYYSSWGLHTSQIYARSALSTGVPNRDSALLGIQSAS